MKPEDQDDGEALCREIVARARRSADELVAQARRDADTSLADAVAAAEADARRQLEETGAEATRRRERERAATHAEQRRLRYTHIESILEHIRAGILRHLKARTGYDYREALVALAAEAISRMSGTDYVIRLSPGDLAEAGDTLMREILAKTGRPGIRVTLAGDAAITEGGLIISDIAGTREWDNRLAVRLERLWPALRRQLISTLFPDWENEPGSDHE